jgi:hypothetical protein
MALGKTESRPRRQPTPSGRGEEKSFESDRSGVVPIFGAWTGNQGWALYRTFADGDFGSPQEVFLKFSWNLPYISFSAELPYCNGYKYNPLIPLGEGEFDTRDKSSPDIHVNRYSSNLGGGDYVLDALQAPPLPLTLIGGENISIQCTFDVLDSRTPGSTKFPPFSDGTKPKAIPESMSNTNASMWVGTWAGEQILARIVARDGNMLAVTVSERRGDELIPGETQLAGINRMLIQSVLASALNTDVLAPRIDLTPEIYVQQGIGTPRPAAIKINPWSAEFGNLVKQNKELVHGVKQNRIQIGGDFLNLEPNAVLEMYRMVADGEMVDVALRYRRPLANLMIAGFPAIDELLHYVPDVR